MSEIKAAEYDEIAVRLRKAYSGGKTISAIIADEIAFHTAAPAQKGQPQMPCVR